MHYYLVSVGLRAGVKEAFRDGERAQKNRPFGRQDSNNIYFFSYFARGIFHVSPCLVQVALCLVGFALAFQFLVAAEFASALF